MRWLILALALLNLGYLAWAWHDGRLDPDPYADVPPLERNGGAIDLLDVQLEIGERDDPAAGDAASEGRAR